ncbi:uncharacterized protein LY89DRAFT_739008 [Mollisia scopiformis]|uniref:Uncharacterized protein n=1 Tax=Mollisia scopiformis TaxID=149040 RepID=A0A194WUE3_MOLSC|nr:uncharacterized protein LY89DRAFT_739008 [Mollisia scopiformis]KUJ11580.1 hypothetical protein LY89DRAFT_739008 [Mollisia scopiformis]
MRYTLAAAFMWPWIVIAGSLTDIKHVVFLMQSGRSFDHYFGTMSGVKGIVTPGQSSTEGVPAGSSILPWPASYLGGNWTDVAQCMIGGYDGWSQSHQVWDNGANDDWASANTPNSMAYFTRDDIPTHFGIAEAYTVGDMYQQAVMSSIDPNRVFFFSGSAGIPGGPQQSDEGGPVLQDSAGWPGCGHTDPNLDCWPLKWHPIMKHLQDANVTWQVYQDTPYAHGQQILAGFEDFNITAPGDPMYNRGLAVNESNSFITFIDQAMNGTLPQETLTGKDAGGWFDHVPPTHSPNGTAGEWMQDPYGGAGYTPAGPGQVMFLEKWLQALGYNVTTSEINPWRRQYMSNLINAFDFNNPNYSVPNPPWPATPPNDTVLSSFCGQYPDRNPLIPINETRSSALATEEGFKQVRGNLTEGRYLVFEQNGYALANTGGAEMTTMVATPDHELIVQQWVVEQYEAFVPNFKFYSVVDKRYVENVVIEYLGADVGYSLFCDGLYWGIENNETAGIMQFSSKPAGFNIYSVTYGNSAWT